MCKLKHKRYKKFIKDVVIGTIERKELIQDLIDKELKEDINWKNTKTTQELNKDFFKWRMNFIKEGSFITVKWGLNLKWDFYQTGESVNLGFIF